MNVGTYDQQKLAAKVIRNRVTTQGVQMPANVSGRNGYQGPCLIGKKIVDSESPSLTDGEENHVTSRFGFVKDYWRYQNVTVRDIPPSDSLMDVSGRTSSGYRLLEIWS